MKDVARDLTEASRRRLLQELKGLIGPAFEPALKAYGRYFAELIAQDEGFRAEVRDRFERGRAYGGFPALAALLSHATPGEQKTFFETGWIRLVLPPCGRPGEPWDRAPWDRDREAYREDLYSGLAFAFTDLRSFARGLLEDLRAGGVRLQAEGLRLHVDAPAGVVSDELRTTLRQNKRNLIRLLERERLRLEAADRRGLIISRSREPGYIALHDPTTGEWHEVLASECPPWAVENAKAYSRHRDARDGVRGGA